MIPVGMGYLILALCTLPGAFLGAWLGVKIKGVWFNRILTLVMKDTFQFA